nr:peroxisomal multifunctional enzyme A isoform X2 [Malus domestica]
MASGAELKSESLLELMKEHLKTDAGKEITKKIGLVYQINIAPKKIGFNEVIFIVDLKKGEVKKGAYEGGKPDATFSFKDDDFVKVALGKMNPQIAFMRGAMKIKGSLSAATKFTPDIFPKPSKIQLHEITKGTMNFIISFCFCLCISLLPSFGTPAVLF